MSGKWLTLMEYSAKHRVSISTLRRRIKSEEMAYQLADGKYYLKDEALPTQSAASGSENTIVPPKREPTSQIQEPSNLQTRTQNTSNDHKVCATSEALLVEVKKAYALVLQEKEEQILHLREEASDLKTLVRVLENEVSRLTAMKPAPAERAVSTNYSSQDFDLGLELDTF